MTERNHFECFRVPKEVIDVRGLGYNTVSLVKKAVELHNQEQYDQVWCVFDRDSFPAQDFNEAISLAKRHDIKVAYSNEAFEIWYLLHFNYHTTAITRNGCIDKLSKLLGKKPERLVPRFQGYFNGERTLTFCTKINLSHSRCCYPHFFYFFVLNQIANFSNFYMEPRLTKPINIILYDTPKPEAQNLKNQCYTRHVILADFICVYLIASL